MSEADRLAAAEGLMDEDGLSVVTIAPDEEIYRQAYDIVSNSTLWFCYHRLFAPPTAPLSTPHGVRRAVLSDLQHLFAERVAEVADEGAVVLVQDYQLALAGSDLSRLRPDLRTVHFTHTPFADPAPCGCCRPTPPPNSSMAWRASGRAASTRADGGRVPCLLQRSRLAVGLEAPAASSPRSADPASMRAEAATDAVSRAGVELERSLGAAS